MSKRAPAPTPVRPAPRLSDAERLKQRQAFVRSSTGLLDSTIFAGKQSEQNREKVQTKKRTLGDFAAINTPVTQ